MVGAKRKTRSRIEREGRYGKYKSRSMKLKFVRTPGGRTVVHYKKKKVSKSKCAECGTQLAGTVRERAMKLRKISKSKKRPERPFGGYLCSKCSRKKIVKEARQ